MQNDILQQGIETATPAQSIETTKQPNEAKTPLTNEQIDLTIQQIIAKSTKTKKCPFCKCDIDKKAIRCNHCCCFINHPFLIKSLLRIGAIIGRGLILGFIALIIAIIGLIFGFYSFSTTGVLPDTLYNISAFTNGNTFGLSDALSQGDNYSGLLSEALSALDTIQSMQNSIGY